LRTASAGRHSATRPTSRPEPPRPGRPPGQNSATRPTCRPEPPRSVGAGWLTPASWCMAEQRVGLPLCGGL